MIKRSSNILIGDVVSGAVVGDEHNVYSNPAITNKFETLYQPPSSLHMYVGTDRGCFYVVVGIVGMFEDRKLLSENILASRRFTQVHRHARTAWRRAWNTFSVPK